jgi:hypothetical protein
MSYILADQRHRNVAAAFAAYREYLRETMSRFPPSAWALASSEWYFGFSDSRCPHDSWLESVSLRRRPSLRPAELIPHAETDQRLCLGLATASPVPGCGLWPALRQDVLRRGVRSGGPTLEDEAWKRASAARGRPLPDTDEQRSWVTGAMSSLAIRDSQSARKASNT